MGCSIAELMTDEPVVYCENGYLVSAAYTCFKVYLLAENGQVVFCEHIDYEEVLVRLPLDRLIGMAADALETWLSEE